MPLDLRSQTLCDSVVIERPMEVNNKRVLVVGLGKSGVASALFLKATRRAGHCF